MPKYRKKPVVIEAVQYDGSVKSANNIIDWALSYGVSVTFHCADGDACKSDLHTLKVMTLEGAMEAAPGWWVIKGVKDEFYPCEPDIFDMTYDKEVDEDMEEARDQTRSDIMSAYGVTESDMGGALPHEDKEHPATGNQVQIATKNSFPEHNRIDANCVKHVQGEPTYSNAVCRICTRPKIVHPRGGRRS